MKRIYLILVLICSCFVCNAQSEDPVCRQAFETAKKVYKEKGKEEGLKSFAVVFDCEDDKISAEANQWLEDRKREEFVKDSIKREEERQLAIQDSIKRENARQLAIQDSIAKEKEKQITKEETDSDESISKPLILSNPPKFSFSTFVGTGLPLSNFRANHAATGFNFAAKAQYRIVRGIELFATAEMFYNPANKKDIKTLDEFQTFSDYYNIPIMIGVNLNIAHLGFFGWSVESGCGLNIAKRTNYSFDRNTEVEFGTYSSFAFQVGTSFTFYKRFVLGFNYYVLGSGSTTRKIIYNAKAIANEKFTTTNPRLITIRLGYKF